jgi:hypothetical protein
MSRKRLTEPEVSHDLHLIRNPNKISYCKKDHRGGVSLDLPEYVIVSSIYALMHSFTPIHSKGFLVYDIIADLLESDKTVQSDKQDATQCEA